MQGEPVTEGQSALPSGTTAGAGRPSRSRLGWRKKMVFSLVACSVSLGLLEFFLGLCGVEPLYLTRDPYVGFQAGVPLFVRDGDELRTNPSKLTFFNLQSFPAVKKPNAYRVFCLGGSTTFGHPYHDRTSFCGWLRELLRETAPARDWQVVNCGGVSYAGYRECLLMQELVQYQPDLFVICTGHNEFLEERTYAAQRNTPRWLAAANAVVTQTRIGSVASRLVDRRTPRSGRAARLPAEVDTILEHSIGPTEYHRDIEHRQRVVEHFGLSLDRMCALAHSAGARVVFIKPAANLRDFTPFKSEHGRGGLAELTRWQTLDRSAREAGRNGDREVASRQFLAAAKLDPEYAQGLWDAGDALLAVGRFEEAREYFLRAVDEDICPLRASRPIQAAVEAAAARNGAPLIDFPMMLEKEVAAARGHRIPGDESFLDHVHPTIDVHQRLAWKILEQIAEWRLVTPPADRDPVTRRVSERVLSGIDTRAHALALVQVIQVLSWAGKNAEALRLTDEAEKVHAGLSEVISYRGRLLEKLGRPEEALECYTEAVRRNPEDSVALSRLAFAQAARGQLAAARKNLEAAMRFTPQAAPASFRTALHLGLGKTNLALERWEEAAVQFEAALRLAPGNRAAERLLADALAKREGDAWGTSRSQPASPGKAEP
jgi:tetratricopeptide (TPR) repeat protein